ncbi:LLM class flavin-dependent oxidoreductase [Mycobacteroides abscessus]|uniref:LLM class flavin-dependent oxidoreductase n=1 Tax=Mycobacteroides abscessus TaxID=36809 RepID=UPI0005DDB002|nr:LLM class flavin-dependent oxidoreductase [Mycobacteroides abscessus]CPS43747.1 luciferase family protein [Mycobacteroides abscessus]CPS45574.1 luciferase family protein [Mycobacteroides abscessus]CPS54625.1 luciferase family protein [Mycobacteroides abscessus]CPT37402.1 luciferase family protein [Mycobacteroides abscessus]CPT64455.1 luciferase family protein [Mycobacteroides abscessus]
MSDVRAGIAIWASRHISPKVAGPYAKSLESTGQIDYAVIWDQLTSWFPNALFTPENTPLAGIFPDIDSLQDPFATMAFALSEVGRLGFAVCTDATRRDAPELAQTMLTLASATEGQALLSLGAGEVRHIGPFGRKRSQGLKRLNEALQVLRLLWTEREPVSFDGEFFNLKDAFIGNAGKDRRPEVIAMGGGPRLVDMALRHADGFGTGAPFVYANPEAYGKVIEGHKETLRELGRAGDTFHFGLHHICFIAKSKDDFEQYVDNPLMKWYAATGGRINQRDWESEGIEPVMPLDWHYALHMRPNSMRLEDFESVIEKVTPEMVRKTFFYGTPDDIAAEIKPFVDHGATINLIADFAPMLMPVVPEEVIEASAEICRLIKK